MNMNLFDREKPKFSYPNPDNSLERVTSNSLLWNLDFLKLSAPIKTIQFYHSTNLYFQRLNATSELDGKNLNDLYVQHGLFQEDRS